MGSSVWLVIWQAVSMWIGQEILLVSPVTVLSALVNWRQKVNFGCSIASSLLRIMGGFSAGSCDRDRSGSPCSSVTESPGISGTVYCDSEIYPGSFICDSCADLGIFAQSFCCHFLFNGISYYLYQCSGRDQPYGCSAERMADVFQIPAMQRVRWIYLHRSCPFSGQGALWDWDYAGRQEWRRK